MAIPKSVRELRGNGMREKKKREPGAVAKTVVYIVLRLLVIAVLAVQIYEKNWMNVFTCVLVLVLFMLPSLIAKRFEIEVPNALEIIIVVFIFAADILGEIAALYLYIPIWDSILHAINGFICAAVGFALIDLLNREEKINLTLSPLFVAMVAFCFSMTVGVVWEFFEFSMDAIFHMDMQKDTWVRSINSVELNEEIRNVARHLDIDSVYVNGEPLGDGARYLDIGLIDTMKDLFINFVGAVVFSVFGWLFIRNRGEGFIKHFMPRKKEKPAEDTALESK